MPRCSPLRCCATPASPAARSRCAPSRAASGCASRGRVVARRREELPQQSPQREVVVLVAGSQRRARPALRQQRGRQQGVRTQQPQHRGRRHEALGDGVEVVAIEARAAPLHAKRPAPEPPKPSLRGPRGRPRAPRGFSGAALIHVHCSPMTAKLATRRPLEVRGAHPHSLAELGEPQRRRRVSPRRAESGRHDDRPSRRPSSTGRAAGPAGLDRPRSCAASPAPSSAGLASTVAPRNRR